MDCSLNGMPGARKANFLRLQLYGGHAFDVNVNKKAFVPHM